MWQTHQNTIISGSIYQYQIFQNNQQLTFRQVISLWQTNPDFRKFYSSILAESNFEAYFWESPPVTSLTIDQLYEFVLVDSGSLAKVNPEPGAFGNQFAKDINNKGVITFQSLGGDAVLVAPCPIKRNHIYTHLANFIRGASEEQIDTFWQQVGLAMEARVNDKSVWLSTAGMGVYWLHVRLDSRPKYYRYGEYKYRK